MINIYIFAFGVLVTTCVTIFIIVTRSEFKKIEAHPERYPRYYKDYFAVEENKRANRNLNEEE